MHHQTLIDKQDRGRVCLTAFLQPGDYQQLVLKHPRAAYSSALYSGTKPLERCIHAVVSELQFEHRRAKGACLPASVSRKPLEPQVFEQ